jgi:hypothetical protein
LKARKSAVISRQDAAFRRWDEVRSHEEQDGLQSEAALRGPVLPPVQAVPSIELGGSQAGVVSRDEAGALVSPVAQEQDGFLALLRALAEQAQLCDWPPGSPERVLLQGLAAQQGELQLCAAQEPVAQRAGLRLLAEQLLLAGLEQAAPHWRICFPGPVSLLAWEQYGFQRLSARASPWLQAAFRSPAA